MSPLVVVTLLLLAQGRAEDDDARDARWFLGGRTVTKVVVDKHVLTEVTPSSCVVVEPSLPPCRNLRQLAIEPTPATKVVITRAATLPEPDVDTIQGRTVGRYWTRQGTPQASEPIIVNEAGEIIETPNSGWGTWRSDKTITRTVVEAATRRYVDPGLVVTFSVTGCQPTKMPFDLAYCDAVPPVTVTKVIG